ncbi:PaaI family thioesterase [Corynebacterium lactis]|uniref:Esterase n=1 Tax=Corynebacterium lactis RW2-5 TaxID=1408189 RepID=A0A0K2GXQ8_9CORY|nr:PaaI family thioesterase [Corynebacterium lactis]ALA66582.1 esterase [Corynebacterium lactis RW2-5]
MKIEIAEMRAREKLSSLLSKSMTSGFDKKLNLTYLEVRSARVHATVSVDGTLHQPAGIVHGGVMASIVEAVGSAGGYAWLIDRGSEDIFVGTTNTTDFLKSTSDGVLEAIGEPIHQGKRSQVWRIEIKQIETGATICVGTLRGQNIPSRQRG